MANGDQQQAAPTIDFSQYVTAAPAKAAGPPKIDFAQYAPQKIADTTTIGPKTKPSVDLSEMPSGLDQLREGLRNSDHPMANAIADKLDDLKELLFGGQSVGKFLGTSSGIVNNPVTQAMAGAPGTAEAGAAFENAATRAAARVSPEFATSVAKTVAKTVADEIPGFKTASKIAKYATRAATAGGTITLPADAFDISSAEEAITPSQGVGAKPPAPTVRRVPGEVAPERVSSAPAGPTPKPTIQTSGDTLLPGGGVIKRPPAGLLPEKTIDFAKYETPAPKSISDIVDQATGNKPLEQNVPLKAQPTIKRGTPGSRVAMDTEPRTVAPEKVSGTFEEEVGKATGAQPLNPKVPLKKQALQGEASGEETPQARLERLYPDSGTRQMVHANGEDIVKAIGDDKPTMKAVHDLTNTDLRQALLNAGEDMTGEGGQALTVGSRKAVGNQISRQEAFKRLLDKGHAPTDIVKLAKTTTLSSMANP